MMKKLLCLFVVGFIVNIFAVNSDAAADTDPDPYQCFVYSIPCGWGGIFYETWCVDVPANANVFCTCGAEPHNPCSFTQ
jgi:hypothetical protein